MHKIELVEVGFIGQKIQSDRGGVMNVDVVSDIGALFWVEMTRLDLLLRITFRIRIFKRFWQMVS